MNLGRAEMIPTDEYPSYRWEARAAARDHYTMEEWPENSRDHMTEDEYVAARLQLDEYDLAGELSGRNWYNYQTAVEYIRDVMHEFNVDAKQAVAILDDASGSNPAEEMRSLRQFSSGYMHGVDDTMRYADGTWGAYWAAVDLLSRVADMWDKWRGAVLGAVCFALPVYLALILSGRKRR